jgi:hypothetical protein
LTRTYGKPALENAIESLKLPGMKPFEEIVKFISDTAGIEKLSASKPSEAAEKRVAELLATASARP